MRLAPRRPVPWTSRAVLVSVPAPPVPWEARRGHGGGRRRGGSFAPNPAWEPGTDLFPGAPPGAHDLPRSCRNAAVPSAGRSRCPTHHLPLAGGQRVPALSRGEMTAGQSVATGLKPFSPAEAPLADGRLATSSAPQLLTPGLVHRPAYRIEQSYGDAVAVLGYSDDPCARYTVFTRSPSSSSPPRRTASSPSSSRRPATSSPAGRSYPRRLRPWHPPHPSGPRRRT